MRPALDGREIGMGYALVWFAIQGKPRDQFLADAFYVDTGDADDYFEADASVGDLPGGWTVLVCADFDLFTEETLRDWSAGGRLVACVVEEDALVSVATEWADGRLVWTASHDGAEGSDELEVSGELPPAFETIRAELLRKADDAGAGEVDHVFDAPLDLAEAITGFRHDRVYEGAFTALEPA
jgi:hypothetical protein